MNTILGAVRNRIRGTLAWTVCLRLAAASHAELFSIQVGDTVSTGVPTAGAGYIEAGTTEDLYTLNASAGQIVFLEEVSVASTFQGWLHWDLRAPSGSTLMSAYFQGTHEGRRVLPETGTYTIRVRVTSGNAAHIGAYSFRIRAVPPDEFFSIQVGDAVTNQVPAPGAGNIEVPGANDVYEFNATAGQLAWFEELGAAPAFQGWLQWELKAPSGQSVFRSYVGGTHQGRQTLPENGTYQLRLSVGSTSTNGLGAYGFRIRAIPPDQTFPIEIGQTVSNGVPQAGAGNIEVTGAQDLYTFQGVAGQTLYFENIQAAATFNGWLRWEVKTPANQSLFSAYFTGAAPGRKTLPATGTYTVRCWADTPVVGLVGAYAFRINPVEDSAFSLRIGEVVSDGVPAAGAGNLETSGSQDFYTFSGIAGQRMVFREIQAAAAFGGWLRWEIKTPASNVLATALFQAGREQRLTLPETGLYRLRVYSSSTSPDSIGTYSLATRCDVMALPDKAAAVAGTTLGIPFDKFMCNDLFEIGDAPAIELPSPVSANGGTLALSSNRVLYTPPAGFTGMDWFLCRLKGQMGGQSTNQVTVQVGTAANVDPTVVSVSKAGPNTIRFCLLGQPDSTVLVERSADLQTWTPAGNLTADALGSLLYEDSMTAGKQFYRFRRL